MQINFTGNVDENNTFVQQSNTTVVQTNNTVNIRGNISGGNVNIAGTQTVTYSKKGTVISDNNGLTFEPVTQWFSLKFTVEHNGKQVFETPMANISKVNLSNGVITVTFVDGTVPVIISVPNSNEIFNLIVTSLANNQYCVVRVD